MAFQIVDLIIIEKELLNGDVIVLHSPENRNVWYSYGEKFRLNEMEEGSFILKRRCIGAMQFGGRVLVIYRKFSGKIRRIRFNKNMSFHKEVCYDKCRI